MTDTTKAGTAGSKAFKDAIYSDRATALAEFTSAAAAMADTFAIDIWEILRSNLPTITVETDAGPDTSLAIIMDEGGNLAFAPEALPQLGTLALVYTYGTATLPQSEGAPLIIPTHVHFLNLPKASEILTDAKLADYRKQLIDRDLLLKARKIARLDIEQKSTMTADRIGSLLAVMGRSSSGSEEDTFKLMFPVLQGIIIAQATKKAEALKAAKKFAQARDFIVTYGKERLNRDNMRLCFMSKTAAESMFPNMPQAQWEALLRFAIKTAAGFPVSVIVKDDLGKSVKNEKGEVVREQVTISKPATIFQRWLETRNEVAPATDDVDLSLTFEGLTIAA